LLESNDILGALFEPATCGVLMVDGAQRIRLSNPAFDNMMGISRGMAEGRPGTEVLRCGEFPTGGPGCSSEGPCIACQAWELAARAAKTKREQKSSVVVEVEVNETVYETQVNLRSGVMRLGGKSVTVLILEGLDRLRDRRRWANDRGMHGIIGTDPKMFELFEMIVQVARTDAPVLIRGESGSGKEMVATSLHRESKRRRGLLVPVNCGALPGGLIESELFGHVKGAFTGALRDKKGRFELARGGTIFLDEVGELSPEVQVKLLRVLQHKTFERVGGEETLRADARFISATNRDLEVAVAVGRFRSDLFYRLGVIPVIVPPLRERVKDIKLLAEHLVKKAAEEYGRDAPELSPELEDVLLGHPWPGNVRELENALRHALIRAGDSKLVPEHLPGSVVKHALRRPRPLKRRSKLDEAAVARALRKTQGSKMGAALLLGVSRTTLYRYLAEWQRRDNRVD